MPVDTQQIMDEATKLGDLVAQHPAVARYKSAQKSVAEDPDAARLMSEFNRQLEAMSRQEQSGMPVTDAQAQQLESLQNKIISHIKIKNLNMAQVDFIDLLRKINQTIQGRLSDGSPSGASPTPGTRLAPGPMQ
jgi:cell fate (sporulation/competence/biofilm development) regulator YlbF (YheA/YmcA/DUF963 family)